MPNIRSLLVLGLVGYLTAACTESVTDICNTEATCSGEKLTWRMYDEGESYRKGEGVEKISPQQSRGTAKPPSEAVPRRSSDWRKATGRAKA